MFCEEAVRSDWLGALDYSGNQTEIVLNHFIKAIYRGHFKGLSTQYDQAECSKRTRIAC